LKLFEILIFFFLNRHPQRESKTRERRKEREVILKMKKKFKSLKLLQKENKMIKRRKEREVGIQILKMKNL